MKSLRLLILLGMLPLLAWGAEVGPTRAQTVLDLPHPLLLRVYNGERGTLLVKRARIQVADAGNPDRVGCMQPVDVMRSVKRGEARDVELLDLKKFEECLSLAGYRVPPGSWPVEIAETPVCAACIPAEKGGGDVLAIPFSVRLVMSCPGTLEEYRSFTNYLFFQYPPKGRPILLQPPSKASPILLQ